MESCGTVAPGGEHIPGPCAFSSFSNLPCGTLSNGDRHGRVRMRPVLSLNAVIDCDHRDLHVDRKAYGFR